MLSICGLDCCEKCERREDCGGCGSGNQSCPIAKCSMEHSKVEYCFLCESYPCEKYEGIDAYDSFISHKNQKADLAKAVQMGLEHYNREQQEKRKLLDELLSHYNDGRKKTFYCQAVNLLELSDLLRAADELAADDSLKELPEKERCRKAAEKFQRIADEKGISLKLRKKRNGSSGLIQKMMSSSFLKYCAMGMLCRNVQFYVESRRRFSNISIEKRDCHSQTNRIY